MRSSRVIPGKEEEKSALHRWSFIVLHKLNKRTQGLVQVVLVKLIRSRIVEKCKSAPKRFIWTKITKKKDICTYSIVKILDKIIKNITYKLLLLRLLTSLSHLRFPFSSICVKMTWFFSSILISAQKESLPENNYIQLNFLSLYNELKKNSPSI